MIKIVLNSTKSAARGGATDTNYIDNSYEIIILSVLAVFLIAIAVLFIIAGKRYANKKTNHMHISKEFDDNTENVGIKHESTVAEEGMIVEKQFTDAKIVGRDKYILSYVKELDLVSLLNWNESKANASSVGEITGDCLYKDSDILEIEQRLRDIESRAVDCSDNETKFLLLDITHTSCKITPGGNFVVKADITVNKGYRKVIGNSVLDGSLLVTVTDSDGHTAGHGFICAEGFNETDLNKVGFPVKDDKSRSHTFVAICTADKINPEENTKYTAVITPHRLWTIEK